MRRIITGLAGLFVFVTISCGVASAFGDDQCLTCHEAIGDKNAALFRKDVHHQRGITCAGCHGGDSTKEEMELAMNKAAGYIGVPKGDQISERCSRCHSSMAIMTGEFKSPLSRNQSEQVSRSVHGDLSTAGGKRIIQCTTCHNSHGILNVKNPASPVNPRNIPTTCAKCHSSASFMKTYNPALPIDQLEKYRTSVHGRRNAGGDLKVAECASCHGSHEILPANDVRSKVYASNLPATCATCHSDAAYMRGYKLPSDQLEKFSGSVHGVALLKKGDKGAPSCNDCHGNHGAAPPGIESISKVCGTCHALNASLFAKSPHKQAFDRKRLPECETCHGHHEIFAAKDELLGVTGAAVCGWCHKQNPPNKGFTVAKTMRSLIDTLIAHEKQAQALIDDAEQKGMEVSEAKFRLREVRQSRLESRTMVHSFDLAQFEEVVDKGRKTATEISIEGQQSIDEFYFRRWGMGVSTLIITVLAVALYLTIRRIEKRQREEIK